MGFVPSSSTIQLYAYFTQYAREKIFNGDVIDFKVAQFSLHDDDVNYLITSNSNGTINQPLTSGFVPDLTGDPDYCIKSMVSGILSRNMLTGTTQNPIPIIQGCTDPLASNYNPLATVNNGTCLYVEPPTIVYGCTDPLASNYNSLATVDDGSCVYAPPPVTPTYSITPNLLSIFEGDGVIFTISTTNVPNGTVLYWTNDGPQSTTQSQDFVLNTNNGTVTINNNTATISSIVSKIDFIVEGTEYMQLNLRTGSAIGPIVATSVLVEVKPRGVFAYEVSQGTINFTESLYDWTVYSQQSIESVMTSEGPYVPGLREDIYINRLTSITFTAKITLAAGFYSEQGGSAFGFDYYLQKDVDGYTEQQIKNLLDAAADNIFVTVKTTALDVAEGNQIWGPIAVSGGPISNFWSNTGKDYYLDPSNVPQSNSIKLNQIGTPLFTNDLNILRETVIPTDLPRNAYIYTFTFDLYWNEDAYDPLATNITSAKGFFSLNYTTTPSYFDYFANRDIRWDMYNNSGLASFVPPTASFVEYYIDYLN